MYLNGLDELDQMIIQLLVKNAHMSYSDIGEKIGISRVAIKARIQALENKGILKNIQRLLILRRSVVPYLAILR
ncbi:AsnC family transcriptional regulator [uncultured Catenibacterium sp.]|uniref:AsnC family transcriptional regulator n=1 Tax=uncultured Catenibacterium sp. TaxID=286142 RepID=UPI0025E7CE13|nr:AsnC family transcriptional regulator [uncultured Catenibacterium sp.]